MNVEDVCKVISDDIVKRQALVTADFTRPLYSESCKFRDEIGEYEIDQYISGTKKLFDAKTSHVDLISSVEYAPETQKFSFQFSEKLVFNLPFRPKAVLSGRVELTKNTDGLIIYSREFWDQNLFQILQSVYF